MDREFKIVIKWGNSIIGYQIVDFVVADVFVEIKANIGNPRYSQISIAIVFEGG